MVFHYRYSQICIKLNEAKKNKINEILVIICKIDPALPLYKLDEFVNNFRKKYDNILIDVKLSKEEYLVLVSKEINEER